MKSNQIGRFRVSTELIRTQPELVARVFAMLKIVPVRAEQLFHERAVEYVAISEEFGEVESGCPGYTLRVTDDGNFLVEVEKVQAGLFAGSLMRIKA